MGSFKGIAGLDYLFIFDLALYGARTKFIYVDAAQLTNTVSQNFWASLQ